MMITKYIIFLACDMFSAGSQIDERWCYFVLHLLLIADFAIKNNFSKSAKLSKHCYLYLMII